MKTIYITFICLLCSLFSQAQDQTILQSIRQANKKITGIEARFTQTQTSAAKKKSETSEGTLYLTGQDKMAMLYKAPSSDLLVINGDNFYMRRGKRSKLYNTAKNATMKRLSGTLLHCLHGTPLELVKLTDSDLSTTKDKNHYIVTLTAKKKQVRGYAKIILHYDIKSKLLVRMQMDEYNGNSTVYAMSGSKTNGNIKTEVFNIPEK